MKMLDIYRAKTNEDLDAVKGLIKEYVASWSQFDGPRNIKEVEKACGQLENLLDDFGPPDGCLLLAKYDSKAVGCIALEKYDTDICQMKRLYVSPKFRRLNIGRELALHVIDRSQTIGYKQMLIHTLKRMKEGYELYKSLGFQAIAPYEDSPKDDAVFYGIEIVLREGSKWDLRI